MPARASSRRRPGSRWSKRRRSGCSTSPRSRSTKLVTRRSATRFSSAPHPAASAWPPFNLQIGPAPCRLRPLAPAPRRPHQCAGSETRDRNRGVRPRRGGAAFTVAKVQGSCSIRGRTGRRTFGAGGCRAGNHHHLGGLSGRPTPYPHWPAALKGLSLRGWVASSIWEKAGAICAKPGSDSLWPGRRALKPVVAKTSPLERIVEATATSNRIRSSARSWSPCRGAVRRHAPALNKLTVRCPPQLRGSPSCV